MDVESFRRQVWFFTSTDFKPNLCHNAAIEKYIYGVTTDGGLQCSYLVVSEHNTKGPMIAIAIVTPSIMAKVTYVHVPTPSIIVATYIHCGY